MSSELQDLSRECRTHGATTLSTMREGGGFRHEYLLCGCTIEIHIGNPIAVGDAVLHDGCLFRVEGVHGDGNILIANVNTHKTIESQFVQRIGVDTLSDMYLKDVPTSVKKDTFVLHRKLEMVGCVTELLGGSLRCCVADADTETRKTFIWPVVSIHVLTAEELASWCTCRDEPHHPSCALSADQDSLIATIPSDLVGPSRYFPNCTPRERPSHNSRNDYPSTWGYVDLEDRPKRRDTQRKQNSESVIIRPDSYGISTADLIKDEVRNLEKQQLQEEKSNTRPLHTQAHKGTSPVQESTLDVDDLQIKKRRGSW